MRSSARYHRASGVSWPATALPLVVLLPMMWRRPPKPLALWLALAIAATTVLGLVLSFMLPQAIGEPMALVLPINLALAWAIWHLSITNQSTAPSPAP